MTSHADMDDDDIYPENNESYQPHESKMQDVDDEEEGEEVESDSDVRSSHLDSEDVTDLPRTTSTSSQTLKTNPKLSLARVCNTWHSLLTQDPTNTNDTGRRTSGQGLR